jgi:hypothetical protein
MLLIKQSESTAARRRIPFKLVDATDGFTPEPGLTFSGAEIQVLKNGDTWTNAAGSATDKGNGSYDYEPTAGEVDTLGHIQVRINKSGAREFTALAQVVAFDPYDAAGLGLTRLDAAITSRATPAQAAAADLQILASGTLQAGSLSGATLAAASVPVANAFQDCAILIVHGSGFREVTGIESSDNTDDTVVFSDDLKVTAATGEAYYIIAGTKAALLGNPQVDLYSVGGSVTRKDSFAQGLDLIPRLVVSAVNTTPTETVFRVTGMPTLGNLANLNGRPLYFRTGSNNLARRNITGITNPGGGEHEITVSPGFPVAPSGDDECVVM